LLAFVALAGCRQVLGLDSPRPLDGAAGGDGSASGTVTGQVLAHVVHNDGSGAPIVDDGPGALGSDSARLDDGTLAPITFGTDGTFSFQLEHPGQGYRVTTQGVELQTAVPHLTLSQPRLCRAGALPVTQPTPITYSLNDPAPSGSVVFLSSTGCWMVAESQSSDARHFSVDWQQAGSTIGPALLDAQQNDRLYYLRLDQQGGGPSMYVLNRYRVDQLTLQDGVPATVSGTSQSTPSTQCVRIMGDEVAELARIEGAGYTTGQAASAWEVAMAAVPDLSPAQTMYLAEGTTPANTNSNVTLSVGVPAPGTVMIDLLTELVDSSSGAAQITAATEYFVEAPTMCVAPAIGPRVGLPATFIVNGLPLDAQLAVSAASDLVLAWSYAAGTADTAAVTLFDAATKTAIASYLTDGTSIAIPAGTLQPGSYYFLVDATLGMPGVGQGDFATLGYPRATSLVHTATFTVTN